MKKTFMPIILIFVFIVSCSKRQDENTYSISEDVEYVVNNNIVFAAEGKDSLNNFYDIAIVDSFVILGNIYGDTILNIYKNLDFSNSLVKVIKGNGAKEFIEPHVDINKAIGYDTLTFLEHNARRVKKIQINENIGLEDFKSEFLNEKIPSLTEFSLTEKYILGLNIHSRRMFIYNRETDKIIGKNYYPKADIEYNNSELMFLYDYLLIFNKYNETICGALPYLNCVVFFDINLNPQKTVIIGDKLNFPKPDPRFVFNKEKCYFLDACGTADFVYCLYRGASPQDTTADCKIFVFNWKGEHITTIKPSIYIWKIAVNKGNNYLLGLSSRNRWNSMDVVKIPLEGILKK